MNHLHIADIHYSDQERASKDMILLLGNVLKEIYEAKLQWQFQIVLVPWISPYR